MKKILLILFVFIVVIGCKKPIPNAHIWGVKAYLRESVYKGEISKDFPPDVNNTETAMGITFDDESFVNFLKAISKIKNLDGFRIYFATLPTYKDPGTMPDSGYTYMDYCESNGMTLIFVPTRKDDSNPSYHDDVLEQCYVAKINDPAPPSEYNTHTLECLDFTKFDNPTPPITPKRIYQFISQWINKYQKITLPFLECKGKIKAVDCCFKETKSLWYGLDVINGPSDQTAKHKIGLLDYTKYYTENYYYAIVSMKYAGYLGKEDRYKYPMGYQLTLIFDFEGKHPKPHSISWDDYLITSKVDLNEYAEASEKADASDELDASGKVMTGNGGGTDTGSPCPPADNCGGSALPQ
jgi:hypothetical protein